VKAATPASRDSCSPDGSAQVTRQNLGVRARKKRRARRGNADRGALAGVLTPASGTLVGPRTDALFLRRAFSQVAS